ncbi:peroxiredoxin [Pedobacter africanus]|uniref:Peroxiredoxin n=1 Tax=Pedobacter africanus TaxID=151894 RepID=A0ACC6KZH7_9SPHI|nr:TlpA disulfide reductase family protein [Pedobacter africanus]MDR6784488.1 peroxiredoxin [Pedobacter africanus]
MKQLIKITLSFVLLGSFSAMAQDFTLNGSIKNFSGSSVQLHITKDHMGAPEAITIPVQKGKFSYKGKALRSPYFASLAIEPQKQIQFVLYNEPVRIEADANDLKSAKLSGGKQIEQYNQYRQTLGALETEIREIYTKLRPLDKESAAAVALREKNNALNKESEALATKFIAQHPGSGVSPFLLWANRLDMTTEVKLYSSLDSNLLADNSYFKFITPSMVGQRNTAIGKMVPAMKQADTLGNMVSLRDFKGKYLLIDFWASWCVPCRAANPGMVKLYNHYKSKNFTVLGISLDKNDKSKWTDAIRKDGLTWNHISDLKGWDNEISRAFGVNSIPATVLVDPNGVIIARNLSEKELETLLEEKLK